uniref:EGF-like domain-containing protein n=1 Tax=Gongylonema pulchrum TaxID=637853 RepID=A0A183D978_9BILA
LGSGKILFCRNGGHCRDRKGCICPLGFNGTKCETDLCSGFCLNGGICKPVVAAKYALQAVRCACTSGFSGERCEDDWCRQNEGYCLNKGDLFRSL